MRLTRNVNGMKRKQVLDIQVQVAQFFLKSYVLVNYLKHFYKGKKPEFSKCIKLD